MWLPGITSGKRGQTGMVGHLRLEASKDFMEERLLKAFWRENRILLHGASRPGRPGLKFRGAQSEYIQSHLLGGLRMILDRQ